MSQLTVLAEVTPIVLFIRGLYFDIWECLKQFVNFSPSRASQGVNRAFPFVCGDEADEIIDVQTPMLFRLVSPWLHLCDISILYC